MLIETKEQNGTIIYRKTFTFTDEDYKKFRSLPKEEDYALNFWKDVGHRYGFDPTLIEEVKRKGQKTFWKCIEYVPETKYRSFTALTRNI